MGQPRLQAQVADTSSRAAQVAELQVLAQAEQGAEVTSAQI